MRKPVKHEDGQILVLAALVLTLLMVCAAFSIDIGRVAVEKGALQNAVDAAVLAAAQDLDGTSIGAAAAAETAKHYMEMNGYSRSDIAEPTFSNSNATINITGTKTVDYAFARVLGFYSKTITTSASATKTSTGGGGYAIISQGLVDIPGTSVIYGNVRSNGEVRVASRDSIIHGTAESVTKVRNSGNSTIEGGILCPIAPFKLSDYYPSEADFKRSAARVYASNTTLRASDGVFDGQYYVINGPIYVNGTLEVYSPYIKINGSIFVTGQVRLLSTNITVNGSIYAPNNEVRFNNTNITVNGMVVAALVDLSGGKSGAANCVGGGSGGIGGTSSTVKLTM